ncbi:putative RNA-binding protein EEED8.10 [Antedon mediterranea]|uniref:putative RNA-binding protein EEED8.10 n=1 Tax=Antedon mediterranea TaxID=105859 RepID=UPI003AF9272C
MGNALNYSKPLLPHTDSDEGTDVDQIYYYCDRETLNKTVKSSSRSIESRNIRDKSEVSAPSFQDEHNCTIFVGNISYRVTQRELWDFFTSFGNVTKVFIVKDHIKYHRRSKGFGFVTFSTPEEARMALMAKEDELCLDDRLMRIFPADRKRREVQNIRCDKKQIVNEMEVETCNRDELDTASVKDEEATTSIRDELDTASVKDEEATASIRDELDTASVKDEEATTSIRDELDMASVKDEEATASIRDYAVEGIHVIPNDVLLYIFSYLGIKERVQIERVSKRWQSVALKSWQSLEKLDTRGLFGGFLDIMLTDNILRILLKKGCWNLKELDVSSSPYLLTDWAVELIGQRCKKLVKLDLSSVKVTKSSLKFLASSCSQLKWISLKKCNNFGEKGLWWLFHYCKELEYVDVSENYRISGQCFYMLSENLTDLVLDGCRSVTDEGLSHLPKRCPRIAHLDLSGCVSITSSAIKCLSKGLAKLKHLTLKGSYNKISQASLSFSGLTSLEKLMILHNSLLTDATLGSVCGSNPGIRCLLIEGSIDVTDVGINAITSYCKNLEELNISYINQVSEGGLQSLGLLTNLRKLSMKGCHQLSDNALASIGSACMDLEFIDVTGCVNVTEESINVLVDFALKTGKPLRFHLGATSVDGNFVKTINSKHNNSIHISTSFTLLEKYTREDDDTIILGGFYTDDEDDVVDDDEELRANNYGNLKVDWHNEYEDDYHGYNDDFLEADDPFMEQEEWDVS